MTHREFYDAFGGSAGVGSVPITFEQFEANLAAQLDRARRRHAAKYPNPDRTTVPPSSFGPAFGQTR